MYTPNTPQGNEVQKNSQSLMLANFQAIQTLIAVNHGNFDTAVQGKHQFIQFPKQTVDPTTNSLEIALFCKQGTTSGVPELAFKRETPPLSPPGSVITFTEGSASGTTAYTRLPSGILIKYGLETIPASTAGTNPYTITINPVDPVFQTIYNIQIAQAIPTISTTPNTMTYVVINSIKPPWTSFDVLTNAIRGSTWNAYQLYYTIIGS